MASNILTRFLLAMDPRPGDGWGPLAAVRTPLLVVLALVADIAAYGFEVAIPTELLVALNGAAVFLLGHDMGVFAPTPQPSPLAPPGV